MPYLYVLNGHHRYEVFKVGEKPGGEVLGQRDDADVRLRDPWISWSHAKVTLEGSGGLAIEDLGSTNGTYVNCEKAARHVLRDDDVVFLGRTHLLYVESDRPPSARPKTATSTSAAVGREAPPGTLRFVVPGVRQEIPALDASRDSSLSISREGSTDSDIRAPISVDSEDNEVTGAFKGPFADVGRILELDAPDPEDTNPDLPLSAELMYTGAAQSDDHIEIDLEELGLPPIAPPTGEAVRVHSIEDSASDIDLAALKDREIERLREALSAREAELRALREELQNLKEHYLDL